MNKQFAGVMLVAGLSFVPAVIIGSMNAPKKMQDEADIVAEHLPLLAEVPIEQLKQEVIEVPTTVIVATKPLPRPKALLWVCNDPRPLEMGGGEVKVCMWSPADR